MKFQKMIPLTAVCSFLLALPSFAADPVCSSMATGICTADIFSLMIVAFSVALAGFTLHFRRKCTVQPAQEGKLP